LVLFICPCTKFVTGLPILFKVFPVLSSPSVSVSAIVATSYNTQSLSGDLFSCVVQSSSFALLRCYATKVGSCLPTFRDSLLVPASRVMGEDVTDRLFRNVGSQLPTCASLHRGRAESLNYTAAYSSLLPRIHFTTFDLSIVFRFVVCLRNKLTALTCFCNSLYKL